MNVFVRLFAVAGVLVAVAACSGVVSGSAASTPLSATTVILMNPFTVGGPAPSIAIVDERTGHCQSSAVDCGNSNARRCFTNESMVLDPCFVPPVGSMDVALCMQDPTSNEAVKLTITEDSRLGSEGSDFADPWFVELENGLPCGVIGGATGVLNGMRLAYGCGNGDHLYGSVDRSRPVWTIHHQKDGSPTVEVVSIRTAWY